MKGGKRARAGRRQGPKKERLQVLILPVTLKEIHRRSAGFPSVGELFDDVFIPKQP